MRFVTCSSWENTVSLFLYLYQALFVSFLSQSLLGFTEAWNQTSGKSYTFLLRFSTLCAFIRHTKGISPTVYICPSNT